MRIAFSNLQAAGNSPASLLNALERAVLAALFASSVSAILLAARNELVPAPGRGSFGFAFWILLLAGYAILAIAVWAVAGVLAAMLRRPELRRWLIAIPAGAFSVLATAANPRAVKAVFELAGPQRFRWLCPAALLICVAALALAAFLPLRRRAVLRALAGAAAVATWFALSPGGEATSVAMSVARERPSAAVQRFVVVGVDGADWRYIDPLIARGDLPQLADLRARGAWGPLETFQPTLSPPIWTTMATGARPRRHGVRGFDTERLQGFEETLPELHPLRGLGMRQLLDYLRQSGRIAQGPVSSATRRVPAFWNIATALGSPVGVVGWWATAPADRVLGHMVSDRLYFEALVARGRPLPPGLTHPEALAHDAESAIVLPDEIDYEDARPFLDVSAEEFEPMRVAHHPTPLTGIAHEFTYFLSTFETTRRFALRVLEESRKEFGFPSDLLILFRIVDKTSHSALRFSELVQENGGATADELRKFRRVVTGAYRAVDLAVGEIRQAFPEANVIVVSDHGFQLEDEHGGYNHTRAPAGIFIATGPAFRPGRVEGLTVYDIMPLLLYLKGFPQAEDLPGVLPTAALDGSLLSRNPPQRVATYGNRYTPRPTGGTREADAEMRERLRALGYVE